MLQSHSVEVNEDLNKKKELVAIVNFQVLQLNSKTILMVKVLWRSNNVEEHTWEMEYEMRTAYPYLFFSLNFRPFFL